MTENEHPYRELSHDEANDLRSVLRTEAGRRLYYRLVYEVGDIEGRSFNHAIKDGVSADRHSAFAEGRREVARILKAEAISTDFPLWSRMMKERLERAELEESKTKTKTRSKK